MCTPLIRRMLNLLGGFGHFRQVSPRSWFSVPDAVDSIIFHSKLIFFYSSLFIVFLAFVKFLLKYLVTVLCKYSVYESEI